MPGGRIAHHARSGDSSCRHRPAPQHKQADPALTYAAPLAAAAELRIDYEISSRGPSPSTQQTVTWVLIRPVTVHPAGHSLISSDDSGQGADTIAKAKPGTFSPP